MRSTTLFSLTRAISAGIIAGKVRSCFNRNT
ncbi:hypothetical protein [Enterobacter phage vB_ExiM_F5M1E]|nr:hypothetical protein [Enterobacter phage vB_ExiM_F1M1E]UNA03007.1 hypothetical protein [Enterobacter phage vB_ExiM_F2M1E]UNA03328.1 hypothetical protein [Enterobacter phage vB_ExiM_F4M1E]UNA03649.1 hypothetical protein [Enterobacter phage vB_ExiM_F5M1E]UNA03969.1 hypothetical protein [Pantoea phage vB_PdiM_F5M2A]